MGSNTKEKILAAAEKLFVENDHEEISVRKICSVAGVSNGSFYHHIGSKENLFKIYDLMYRLIDEKLMIVDNIQNQTFSNYKKRIC